MRAYNVEQVLYTHVISSLSHTHTHLPPTHSTAYTSVHARLATCINMHVYIYDSLSYTRTHTVQHTRYMARAWERRVLCVYTNTLLVFLHTHTHSTVYTSFGARPEMRSNMHLCMYNLFSHIHTHIYYKNKAQYTCHLERARQRGAICICT